MFLSPVLKARRGYDVGAFDGKTAEKAMN